VLFWKGASAEGVIEVEGANWPVLPIIAACGMLGALVVLTVFAAPITDYLQGTAAQLFDTTDYIRAVLGEIPATQPGQ
jgi:multicomponent K+:H+ antiporter subunit D